ncbi:protein kinase-like protein [Herbihabitans rhizosphaerae]|uniref:non-specific serine/threonine protein kinase n=2 Tax=Herbihabitans rhizosphaerae TaxID=1872711 RepID=A0A4Q7KIQ5_9PSEU|nr:protein kinase-like protein [Herbihabitans rhizosphaerae]
MGVVWRATDEQSNRVVALKQARAADTETHTERGQRRLGEEARIAASLHHDNIVSFHEVVEHRGQFWLVMEHFASESLAKGLAGKRRLSPKRAAAIGAQVADALSAVHAKGVVHRDVSPGNVLVGSGGTAKLTDFGISRSVAGDVTVTATGDVVGNPGYMAPEVARGDRASAASDVFSLGATLYAAVEGGSPYGTGGQVLLLRRAGDAAITPTSRAGELGGVLAALMHPDPGRRPDAAGAAAMLREVADGRAPAVGRVRGGRRPGHIAVVAVAVVLVLVATTALVVALGGGSTPNAESAAPQVNQQMTGAAIRDPRAADACALVESLRLDRFGRTELDDDYGGFDRCDILIRLADGNEKEDVDVKVEFELPSQERARAERLGDLTLLRSLPEPKECVIDIVLTDSNRVNVTVREVGGDNPVDLCAVAEQTVAHIVGVLRGGPIPTRALPSGSLGQRKACDLVDAPVLSRVAGVDTRRPLSEFGDWRCRWLKQASGISVKVIFDRDPSIADDGRAIDVGGREGRIEVNEDGDCVVNLPYRHYRGSGGSPAVELIMIEVEGGGDPQRLCGPAVELARNAVTKLPPL